MFLREQSVQTGGHPGLDAQRSKGAEAGIASGVIILNGAKQANQTFLHEVVLLQPNKRVSSSFLPNHRKKARNQLGQRIAAAALGRKGQLFIGAAARVFLGH